MVPAIIFEDVLKPNVELVIVPALLDVITTDGVLSFVSVLTGVVSPNTGPAVFIVNVLNVNGVEFRKRSVNVTVSPQVLSANVLNVIFMPSIPLVVLLNLMNYLLFCFIWCYYYWWYYHLLVLIM